MLSRKFTEFLNDERGTYTLWSLIWFMLYVALGGLAVDVTDAYRVQTQLQATADAAALAAAMSLGNASEDPVEVAIRYAEINMKPEANGPVLRDVDVQIGTWQFSSETFFPNTTEPNAVYVRTRRDAQNDNQLAMNFLLILQGMGLRPSWNLDAEAVAVRGVNVCHNNGIIANGRWRVTTHAEFVNNICLIGVDSFWFNSNGTSFEEGVYAGTGCSDSDNSCIGPGGNQQFSDEEFAEAFDLASGGNYEDPTRAVNAENVQNYMNAVLSLGSFNTFDDFLAANNTGFVDYSGYEFLAAPGTGAVSYVEVAAPPAPADLEPYTVYEVTCQGLGGNGITLTEGAYHNVAIIAHCPINFPADSTFDMQDIVLGTTNSGNSAVQAPGQVDFGATSCEDGGVEIYSYGRVHFAAATNFANTRILALGEVDIAAQGTGPVGIHIETTDDFFAASGSNTSGGATDAGTFGLCPNNNINGAQVMSFSLVR